MVTKWKGPRDMAAASAEARLRVPQVPTYLSTSSADLAMLSGKAASAVRPVMSSSVTRKFLETSSTMRTT